MSVYEVEDVDFHVLCAIVIGLIEMSADIWFCSIVSDVSKVLIDSWPESSFGLANVFFPLTKTEGITTF